MERADIEVAVITIDSSKAGYIRSKGVEPEDVLEVQFNEPAYFVRSLDAGVFNMIGPNRSGRFLWASIMQVTETEWRLITAYWNDDGRAQRTYEG